VVRLMKGIGVDHCGMADTIGTGTPRAAQAALERALKHYPLARSAGTSTTPTARRWPTSWPAWRLGIATFDTSIAGLGGCPYAKGATGNVATEDVVFMLHGMGIATGLDLDALVDAGAFISGVLGRPPVSRVSKRAAGAARRGACMNDRHEPTGPRASARGAAAGRPWPPACRRAGWTCRRAPRRRPPTRWACRSGQIAKSVIFRRKADEPRCWWSPRATAGSTRSAWRRSPGRWAAPMPTSSRQQTGFSIGGVAPLAHRQRPVTLIDRELFRFDEIWAAAGHPNGVFRLSPQTWCA
jgi:prolyl-tRNA editing enzyme YbaK/EbsC (Cys-tRNA(Pro) deacylase)